MKCVASPRLSVSAIRFAHNTVTAITTPGKSSQGKRTNTIRLSASLSMPPQVAYGSCTPIPMRDNDDSLSIKCGRLKPMETHTNHRQFGIIWYQITCRSPAPTACALTK